MSAESTFQWDPMRDHEADNLTSTAATRIKRDLMDLYTNPPPGIFVIGDEKNLKFIHAIIIGPMATPYEGGFFYFILKCPNDYPLQPPKVKLLTTDGGKVRFNPNLYKNGKICISVLGTWTGPAWSPAQRLSSLLLTIQSLLTEKPYFNEPGYEKERMPGDSTRYNEIITHETLRVAICGMAENDCHLNIPKELQPIIKDTFLNFYDQYLETVNAKMHLTGHTVHCSMLDQVTLDYASLKTRLKCIKKNFTSSKDLQEDDENYDS